MARIAGAAPGRLEARDAALPHLLERFVAEERDRVVDELRASSRGEADEAAARVLERVVISLDARGERRLGRCLFRRSGIREIRVSAPYFLRSPENREILSRVIRHEFAHAVLGPSYGHGEVFRTWARRLGGADAPTVRHAEGAEVRPRRRQTRYTVACEDGCGRTYELTIRRIRSLDRYRCRCGGRLRRSW